MKRIALVGLMLMASGPVVAQTIIQPMGNGYTIQTPGQAPQIATPMGNGWVINGGGDWGAPQIQPYRVLPPPAYTPPMPDYGFHPNYDTQQGDDDAN